ncbi:MAG: thiol-activated cytolysin family protein, partial [Deltaproteobacteria bacterium]
IYEANPALHKENNPPMYISSVSYGRTLIFIFSSDVESSLMKASLEAAFNGTLVEGNLNVKAEEQKLFQNFETKVLVLGGSGESMVHLLTGDKTKGINEWIAKGANFSQKSPGVPISYMARYLRDYDIAKLSLNTQYEVRTSQPIPIKNFQIAFHTLDDNKDAEEAVDVWITQEGQILYQGSFGQGENWNDHTEKGFTLPMTANFKGGLNSCNGMKLRIRKRPSGSEKGCGWNMALDFVAHLEHGRGYSALSVEDSKGKRWGDDSDYDRTFTLKCK